MEFKGQKRGMMIDEEESRRAIENLRRFMGDRYEKLVGLYIEAGDRHVDVMAAGLAEGDMKAVSDAAHAMKSSSGNMGFPGLGVVAGRIEAFALSGGGEGLADNVADFTRGYERAREMLRASVLK